MFEMLWRAAVPFSLDGAGVRRELHPAKHATGYTDALLPLLASGVNDKTIEHELGISHRTPARRIVELDEKIGRHDALSGWLVQKNLPPPPHNLKKNIFNPPQPRATRPGNTFVTNGNVQAVVRSGDTIYIGGLFNRVGPRTGPGVELALDGSQIAGLPEVSGGDGTLQAVASDGSGGWYIGGLFTHVGGVARNNIAHIRADHSVDPAFDPNANDGIHALAVSGSTVYAAGLFTSIGGQTRNRIAGLNAANGTATAFNPNADAGIEALAISDSGSIIYAGADSP